MLHYRAIVKDHLSRLILSALYDHIDGICCFLLAETDSARDEAQQLLQAFGSKVHIANTSSDMQQAERFTLLGMRRLLSPGDSLLYMHSKGISYDPTSELGARMYWWALYMQWHLIKHAHRCLELLEAGHDVVGVIYFQTDPASRVRPHFSGNFWWARASYVLQLNDTVGHGYLEPEFYIMSGSPRYESLWQSDNDIYLSEYPPRLYLDRGSALVH